MGALSSNGRSRGLRDAANGISFPAALQRPTRVAARSAADGATAHPGAHFRSIIHRIPHRPQNAGGATRHASEPHCPSAAATVRLRPRAFAPAGGPRNRHEFVISGTCRGIAPGIPAALRRATGQRTPPSVPAATAGQGSERRPPVWPRRKARQRTYVAASSAPVRFRIRLMTRADTPSATSRPAMR